jgi:hypothetical protein
MKVGVAHRIRRRADRRLAAAEALPRRSVSRAIKLVPGARPSQLREPHTRTRPAWNEALKDFPSSCSGCALGRIQFVVRVAGCRAAWQAGEKLQEVSTESEGRVKVCAPSLGYASAIGPNGL